MVNKLGGGVGQTGDLAGNKIGWLMWLLGGVGGGVDGSGGAGFGGR